MWEVKDGVCPASSPGVGVTVYIGLGGNQGDVRRVLTLAMEALGALPGVSVSRLSGVYRTEPQGLREQPFFFNQVAALTCDAEVEPEGLLKDMLALETQFGRDRRGMRKNAPRPLDLDLLLFGQELRHSPFLILPHPRMRLRAFVLVPLAEIAPELCFPDGGGLADALAGIRHEVRDGVIFQDACLAGGLKP